MRNFLKKARISFGSRRVWRFSCGRRPQAGRFIVVSFTARSRYIPTDMTSRLPSILALRRVGDERWLLLSASGTCGEILSRTWAPTPGIKYSPVPQCRTAIPHREPTAA